MAAASRLLRSTSSLFFSNFKRASRLISPSVILLSSPHPRCLPFSLFFAQPLAPRSPIPVLRSLSTSSAEAIVVDIPPVSTVEPPAHSHPWPEWELFLDKLRAKGYFEASTSAVPTGDAEDGGASVSAEYAMEVNRLKNACLKFARERFDIFSSLPRDDIQAVVECGCPNVFRKAVNSAKRLRAYLQLNEGDVCGACNLRGSCDKAYIIPKDDEGPRTVDVVRILLSYAINPKHLSGEENFSVKEHVQKSARNILSELIKLSDTTINLSICKSVVEPRSPKEPSQRKVIGKGNRASNVEMKKGDWFCPNCNFLNYARNLRCLECKEEGPKKVAVVGAEMKLGDWNCPECEFMNFARNRKCFRCQGERPKRELNPGEWECPKCYYVNFRRNQVCKKCYCDRPEEEGNPSEDHSWRSPRQSTKNNTRNFGDDDYDDDNVVDDDDDILPLSGESKFITIKRATPAERKFTSARNRRDE